MAALPLIPNVYEVSTFGTLYGKPCDHVIHWHITASAGQEVAACDSLVAADVLYWIPDMQTLLPGGYEHLSSRAVYLGSLAVPESNANAGLFGDETGARVPAMCAVTIRHQSPTRGKGKDGRTNIPGPTIADVQTADYYSLTTTRTQSTSERFAIYRDHMITKVQADLSLATAPQLAIASRKLGTFQIPSSSLCDPYLTTHRRWVKRLARHRRAG